jgi:hypothetical protein
LIDGVVLTNPRVAEGLFIDNKVVVSPQTKVALNHMAFSSDKHSRVALFSLCSTSSATVNDLLSVPIVLDDSL